MFDHLPTGKYWDRGLDLVTGCTHISPACDHCWAAEKTHRAEFQKNQKIQARYRGLTNAQGCFTGEVRPQWQDLDKIGRARKPQVYTFWNDLFHESISFDLNNLRPDSSFVDEVLIKIISWPRHFYIICTKRSHRALEYFLSRQDDIAHWPEGRDTLSRRLMLMTTTENQALADLRLPQLLQIPGVLHGVSIEPCLGPVDLQETPAGDILCHCDGCMKMTPNTRLDFVVTGGETGPRARPSHPDWFRQLRDDCQAAGVPFFFKGWGEWALGLDHRCKTLVVYDDGRTCEFTREALLAEEKRSGIKHNDAYPVLMSRVGKRAAGRLLDGREHNGVPEIG